ncbi:MAG TPA: hypothetical protein VHX15_15800 [Frankiaceae bacterium]|jgi:hypothetical protein|nr:hypothetical protein [Frankiaceae bacterium]
MADESDPQRDAVHEAIAANSTVPSAILTGWVVVAEWMDVDGDRWLSFSRSASTPNLDSQGHDARGASR